MMYYSIFSCALLITTLVNSFFYHSKSFTTLWPLHKSCHLQNGPHLHLAWLIYCHPPLYLPSTSPPKTHYYFHSLMCLLIIKLLFSSFFFLFFFPPSSFLITTLVFCTKIVIFRILICILFGGFIYHPHPRQKPIIYFHFLMCVAVSSSSNFLPPPTFLITYNYFLGKEFVVFNWPQIHC